MDFISSAKNISGKEEVNTASIPTAITQVSPASANVAAASISHDTACVYIASQSNGSQIKYEDINQIDEDDIEEMDIKWNMALLSMRADRFWKKTGKKITIRGTDVAGFDKSKVECFNCHKMGHFARECRSLVDCLEGVRPIGTKWVLKNKKDERGIVIGNKARLVDQGHTQEEGIDYEELCREFEALMHEKFQMSVMGELNFFLGLQVLQKKDGIFLSQDKYVGDILKKFGYSDVRSANTPMDKENPWGKDGTDSDYGGATQDRKSTSRGCQFLGRRLISWQCKKQIIVATSTTKAEYVTAASGCGQVLWIQNQLLDYGNHLIRDCFEKKLISVDHIHTDDNVADLLTKPFDAGRFQYLVVSIGMVNP
nr:hypothetical protein [Tanacetum cinerariifolium]